MHPKPFIIITLLLALLSQTVEASMDVHMLGTAGSVKITECASSVMDYDDSAVELDKIISQEKEDHHCHCHFHFHSALYQKNTDIPYFSQYVDYSALPIAMYSENISSLLRPPKK